MPLVGQGCAIYDMPNKLHSLSESIGWIDSPALLLETITRVKDVQSVGLDVGIDFHGRLHKGMAKQLAKLLEPLHPLFIEGSFIVLCRHSKFREAN